MSWHPTDDDLILHFYKEDPDHEALIARHLESCEACRMSWHEIQDTLRHVDAQEVPEPGPAFERVMWARIQPALEAPRRSNPFLRLWLPALGLVAASLVVGVVTWRALESRHDAGTAAPAVAHTPAPAAVSAASRSRERVLLTALDEHFEETQILLTELMNAPAADADLGFARDTAGDLIASGRLYRATARQTGDLQMAAMLDDLETVLVDVSHGPERMDANDLDALRSRITDASLLFKVRAVSNEIRERQKTLASSTE